VRAANSTVKVVSTAVLEDEVVLSLLPVVPLTEPPVLEEEEEE